MAYADRSYVVNQGRVFLAERAFNGALTSGLDWIGDADQVELSVVQRTDTMKNQFTGKGETIAAPVTDTDCTLKIQALDMRLQNWAIATWGDPTVGTSGHVSSEAITLYNGKYAKLGRIGVSNVVVAGATAGTDYTVDSAAHGILLVKASSTAVPLGSPLTTTVSYDYAANNGKVEAFVLGRKFYQVVVAGVNAAQGNQPTLLRVRQVQLQMAKSFGFLAKRHMSLELQGDVLYDGSLPRASAPGDLSNLFSWERA